MNVVQYDYIMSCNVIYTARLHSTCNVYCSAYKIKERWTIPLQFVQVCCLLTFVHLFLLDMLILYYFTVCSLMKLVLKLNGSTKKCMFYNVLNFADVKRKSVLQHRFHNRQICVLILFKPGTIKPDPLFHILYIQKILKGHILYYEFKCHTKVYILQRTHDLNLHRKWD